jgi:hypothetical protein
MKKNDLSRPCRDSGARMRAAPDRQPSIRTDAMRHLYFNSIIWQHTLFFEFGYLDAQEM